MDITHSTSAAASGSADDQTAQAAASLQLFLREDRLLIDHGLTQSKNPDQVAFPYAAALLEENEGSSSAKHRADVALQDVERKLALVESLAVKLSRTSPEAVAGHLLRLHGHQIIASSNSNSPDDNDLAFSTSNGSTLHAVRERADRLEKQSETLENVAKRVENSLNRGLERMDNACTKLERTLTLSSSLKMILRAQFEAAKLQNYDLDDLRDLTRAAKSVSILEDLLAKEEMQTPIEVVERLKPQAISTARAVREAAAVLLGKYSEGLAVPQLGATLQVFFQLGELPRAVWKAVGFAHEKAVAATTSLWNPNLLANLNDQAKKQAKDSRMVNKKLVQLRSELADTWRSELAEAATSVRNLQRVLLGRSDAETRKAFMAVVAEADIPPEYEQQPGEPFSLFALFWDRYCRSLADTLEDVMLQDHGKLVPDVAALYPAIRRVSIELVAQLQESLSPFEDAGTDKFKILGGTYSGLALSANNEDNPQSADTWTHQETQSVPSGLARGPSSTLTSVVFLSSEWKTLCGESGLYPLQRAFVESCTERLCQPLQYMFPENIALDDDGVPVTTGLSLLPTKYDISRFDETIRQELSLADPKEGGGEYTIVTMIADCIVVMISQFCTRATSALSGAKDLNDDYTMTDSLQHDRKIAAIMYTLKTFLLDSGQKTFVAPYKPNVTKQQEDAVDMCLSALKPAFDEIDNSVSQKILQKLWRATNERLLGVFAKIHFGVYSSEDGGSFVQNHLSPVYETVSSKILTKFPPPYSRVLAEKISSFSIYAFVSNAALIRPLGESGKLGLTQDLADLELSLEQLVAKGGGNSHLSSVFEGNPYAELRAVRQLLFWNGLDSGSKTSNELANSVLRESWVRDIRPSTMIHFLLAYGPSLLSSPHHVKRVKAEVYAESLVTLDGEVNHGEEDAWMVVMSCCDSYQQRAASSQTQDGDARVAQLLLALGPELLRRRK